MKTKITNLKKLFEDDLFLKIISVIIAIISWIVVVYTVDPMKNYTIENIPLDISLAGTSAETSGLSIIGNTKDISINYTIHGKAYEINKLSANDFKATCEIVDVTTPGTYTLKVVVKKVSDSQVEYNEVSISKPTVNVTFDRIVSSVFPLEAVVTNKEPDEGYVLDQYSVIPKELTVSGPEGVMKTIKKVVVENNEEMVLKTSTAIDGKIRFLDENGQDVDTTNLVYKDTQFKISIPLYKKMTLPLTFDFINVPNGIDTNAIKYTMSPVDKLNVAVPVDAAANTTEISLGSVDFRTLSLGKSQTFDISLLAGYINIDQIRQVKVDFKNSEADGYTQSYLTIPSSNINIKNVPNGYTATIISDMIADVQMIGKAEVINNLDASSVVATADLSALTTITEGEQRVPVSITVQNKQQAWALGQKYILISVKKN